MPAHPMTDRSGPDDPARRCEALLRRISSLRVAVVGTATVERWLVGVPRRTDRRDEVRVDVEHSVDHGGGAAAVALALRSLGAQVRIVAPVGADIEAEHLRRLLVAAGIDDGELVFHAGRTPAVRRLVAHGRVVARFDEGRGDGLGGEALEAFHLQVASVVDDVDSIVVVHDGRQLRLADFDGKVRDGLLAHPRVVVAGPELDGARSIDPDIAVIRLERAVASLDAGPWDGPMSVQVRRLASRSSALLAAAGAQRLVITLGRAGAAVLSADAAWFARAADRPADTADPTPAAWVPAAALVAGEGASAELAVLGRALAEALPATSGCPTPDPTTARSRLVGSSPAVALPLEGRTPGSAYPPGRVAPAP